jgi:radical SAM superfamily enzyme YgiQ (UPF0313 family)
LRVLLFNPPLYLDQYYIEAEECCFGAPGRPVVPYGLLRTASFLHMMKYQVQFIDYAVEEKPWSFVLKEIPKWDLAVTSVIHGGFYHSQFLAFYTPLRGQKTLIALSYPESATNETQEFLSLNREKHAQFQKLIPSFDQEIKVNYSLYPYHGIASKVFIVQASTGCRYNCNFCVWAGKRFQPRMPRDVVAQLADIRALMTPSDFVFLLSSQITGDKAWLKEFVELKEKLVPDLTFQGDIGIGEVDEETALLLKRSGIENATVGAEALSDDWLRKFRKPWTYESIKSGCLNLQKAGVSYHIIHSVGVKPGYVKWGKIYPYPGTAIAHLAGKQSFLPELKLYVEQIRQVGWIKT